LGPLSEALYKADTRDASIGVLAYFISNLIISALFFWWIYHCAYKKHGTMLLTFQLICAAIVLVFFSIMLLGSIISKNFVNPLTPVFNILHLLNVCLSTWWYILSVKLRKVNKKLQGLMSPPTNSDSEPQSTQKT
jgi:hypothetical protein